MSVNILLADDHLMVREGLKQVLELDHDIDVISEASDGYECLNLINKTHPDVVLLDINMPNLDGLQVLSIMKQQKMKSKVIMLTIHKDVDYLIEALDAGCDGYVLKDSDSETLKKQFLMYIFSFADIFNTRQKGGEVMDAGASHPSGFFRKLIEKGE